MNDEEIKILKRLQENIDKKYDSITPGFLTYDILASASKEFLLQYILISEIERKLDPRNLTGTDLDKEVWRRGLKRKEATYANGIVTVEGNGTILVGDLFSTETNILFEATEEIQVTGTADVPVKAVVSGYNGNVSALAINQFPETIVGMTSVINNKATTGGVDRETDVDLLERYEDDINNPITSNNIAHFRKWALVVPGVGEAKVFPTWKGNNSVRVVCLGSDGYPIDETVLENVQNYIDPIGESEKIMIIDPVSGLEKEVETWTTWGKGYGQSAIGTYCTVNSATNIELNIVVTVTTETSKSEEEIKTEIENNLKKFLKTTAFNESIQSISYAKILGIIVKDDTIEDAYNLTINGGTQNIPLENDAVATLKSLELNIIFENSNSL